MNLHCNAQWKGGANIRMEGIIEEPFLGTKPEEVSVFESELNQIFQGQESGKPRVSVEILPLFHATPEDMKVIRDKITDADIYIPEVFSYAPEELEGLNNSSSGETPLEEIIRKFKRKRRHKNFLSAIELVYESKKPIAIIDVPKGHPLTKTQEEARVYDPLSCDNFEDVLSYIKKFLSNHAKYQNMREEYMKLHIKPAVEKILRTHPDLMSKENIIVLLSIGYGHSFVGEDYSKVGFSDEGFLRSKKGEGLDNEEGDKLAARVFIENACGNLLFTALGRSMLDIDTEKLVAIKRKVFSQFEIEDAKDIFDEIKKYGVANIYKFIEKINAKKIQLPGNREDVDEFLKQPISENPENSTP